MGLFIYDNAEPPIRIEDRTLWHLKTVILTKLRRNETFSVSWEHPDDDREGYTTIWLHPSIPLRFVFDSRTPPELNREWLARMNAATVERGGIELTQEQVLDLARSATPEHGKRAETVHVRTRRSRPLAGRRVQSMPSSRRRRAT